MDHTSSQERQIEEFLAAQPPWLRKILEGDYDLTREEQSDMVGVNWPELYGQARDKYLELLKRCPKRLRDYRKREKKRGAQSALQGIPSLKQGAPRLDDAVALEASELEQAGLTQADIALHLSRKYPQREDRKGNKKSFTEESVRKLLRRRRAHAPDKM